MKPWYFKYVISALRRIWRWSPDRKKALKNAEVRKDTYRCNACRRLFDRKKVAVDHKRPVVNPRYGFKDWNTYITRLYVMGPLLQVLCKQCHQEKTKEEREIRKRYVKYKENKKD